MKTDMGIIHNMDKSQKYLVEWKKPITNNKSIINSFIGSSGTGKTHLW